MTSRTLGASGSPDRGIVVSALGTWAAPLLLSIVSVCAVLALYALLCSRAGNSVVHPKRTVFVRGLSRWVR